MNIREVSFIYPLLNTIVLRSEEFSTTSMESFISLHSKILPVIRTQVETEHQLLVKNGQKDPNDNDRLKLRTKEQVEAFKRDVVLEKSKEVKGIKLNEEEHILFLVLLAQAITGGYEDFPQI